MLIIVGKHLEASFQEFDKEKPSKLCVMLTKILPL